MHKGKKERTLQETKVTKSHGVSRKPGSKEKSLGREETERPPHPHAPTTCSPIAGRGVLIRLL